MLNGRIHLYLLLYLTVWKVTCDKNNKEEADGIVQIEEDDVDEDENKQEVMKIVAAPDLTKEDLESRSTLQDDTSEEENENIKLKMDSFNQDLLDLFGEALKKKYPHIYDVVRKEHQSSESEKVEKKSETENPAVETNGIF